MRKLKNHPKIQETMLISNVGNKGISLEIAHKDKDETTSQT
jgi:hypothetical protein